MAPEIKSQQALPAAKLEIENTIGKLREILARKNPDEIRGFISSTFDRLARIMLQASTQENIASTEETAIVHAFGAIIWNKPKDTQRVEEENLNMLVQSFTETEVADHERLANGIYFLLVLLHKYKNANGRTARALQLVFNKAGDNSKITEDDVNRVLGINRKSVVQTGETSFKINFNPDFERLLLGVAYFGLHKGLTEDQITEELKLNSKLPEAGLKDLAQYLEISPEKLKEEFIKFMVFESDLSWCYFNLD